jgi:hypothetical protein
LHPGSHGLVIAHDTSASRHLFEMAKLMWEEWPFHDLYTEKHNSQKSLGWVETRSAMSIATARNAGSGRSFTYSFLHASECAFWGDDAEVLMTGLNQSIHYRPGTCAIYESTANGVGNWFHDQWQAATQHESVFTPMFFPWFRHSPYSFPTTTLKLTDLNRDERDLMAHYDLTIPQLAWRRYKIEENMGDENKFHQEFPCSPDEAFISTGTNVFPLRALDECYEHMNGWRGFLYEDAGRVRFKRDATGPLTLFQMPSENRDWGKYVVAGDPSRTAYGDGACIQVFNRRTFEQVAVYHSHIEPVEFGAEIVRLGYFFNDALINCEITGPGYASIAVMLKMDYPDIWRHRQLDRLPGRATVSYGWQSNYHRKHAATGLVIGLLGKSSLLIHDERTHNEMRNFVYLPNGEIGPASPSGNDDAVMALVIAIASTIYNDPLPVTSYEPSYSDINDQTMIEAFS